MKLPRELEKIRAKNCLNSKTCDPKICDHCGMFTLVLSGYAKNIEATLEHVKKVDYIRKGLIKIGALKE